MNNHPFSEEVPELLKTHLEHLKSSALSLEVIKERGYESVLGKLALKEAGFSKAQQRCPGILIPLHSVDGPVIGHQYRPDRPREDSNRKRIIKYENPTGSSVRLDVPPRCREQLGDPGVPLWITEGVKKVDSLASHSACAIGLTGVWGFKGRNPLGGTTILADFDYIALKDRLVYIVFDSDSSSNPQVMLALKRLREHLHRKGAKVRIIQLPPGPDGEKVGVDDYLAQGHTLDDLIGLEVIEEADELILHEKARSQYCIENGCICWIQKTEHGDVPIPLCDFSAIITEEVTRDNGLEISKTFTIEGFEDNGRPLSTVEVPNSSFGSMGWVTAEWGTRAVIEATQTAKGKLCTAMLKNSKAAARRTIYSHTGWRDIEGQRAFLTASGALGVPEVEVEVEESLKNYSLPAPVEDPREALRASYEFFQVGSLEVMLPLWASMYLAPLSEILKPAFTLFLVGTSGALKSTLAALALNHFGEKFTHNSLPAAWRDTQNRLEKMLFLSKDLPLVIDDWAPGQNSADARAMEAKADHVIRAQGNLQGRGRLRPDTSSRKTYIPRGLLITTGEHLPSGHSNTARIFSVEMDRSDIDLERLTAAQAHKHLYSLAMSHYILWLQKKWDAFSPLLSSQHELWRSQSQGKKEQHLRLAEVAAWLYAGLSLAIDFLADYDVINADEASSMARDGWKILINLCEKQSARIKKESDSIKFLNLFRSLQNQGKIVLGDKDDEVPRKNIPGEISVGWADGDGNILLNPEVAYTAIRDFSQHTGSPLTMKEDALWRDLKKGGYTICQNGRAKFAATIYGKKEMVVKLKESALIPKT